MTLDQWYADLDAGIRVCPNPAPPPPKAVILGCLVWLECYRMSSFGEKLLEPFHPDYSLTVELYYVVCWGTWSVRHVRDHSRKCACESHAQCVLLYVSSSLGTPCQHLPPSGVCVYWVQPYVCHIHTTWVSVDTCMLHLCLLQVPVSTPDVCLCSSQCTFRAAVGA